MPAKTPLPPELATAPFSVAEAAAAGLPPSRMRASDLEKPYRGVRSVAGIQSSAVERYVPRLGEGQFFSHATAARLWGISLPRRVPEQPLHVSVVLPSRAPRIAGVTGHHVKPGTAFVTLRPGLRVSTVAATWLALASTLSLDELVIAGDSATRRNNPLTTVEDLVDAVDAAGSTPGIRRARQALALIRPRTDSVKETELRLMMVRFGLPEPVVNFEIRNEHGAFLGFGDLAYPEYKVLVEYDGGQHRDDERQFHRDIDRLDDFMELDWRVIRVNKSHVELRSVARLQKIHTALVARGWRPPRRRAR